MSPTALPIILVNGQQQSTVSALDRGLAYGDGVFETLLVADGKNPFWPYHQSRLFKGLAKLGIHLDTNDLEIQRQQLLALTEQYADSRFIAKLIVTRGQGGRGYQPPGKETAAANVIFYLYPYTLDAQKQDGIRVHFCQQRLALGIPWAGLKTLNQLPYVLAAQEWHNTECDEGLLFSTENRLIEATARNIFIVRGDTLYTPWLNQCGVEGVMRQYVMDKLVPQLDLACVQSDLTVDDLATADEVFLTNSISGVWPVIAAEHYQWPVGPITRSLQSMCYSTFGLFGLVQE